MITTLGCALLTLGIVAYVFFPERRVATQGDKPRVELLAERKTALYDNLRDLSFEHRAGKYSDQEYEEQRSTLEAEAATVLTELDALRKQRELRPGLEDGLGR